ncbi:MAG: response regulator [Hyphomicrobiales bacterium]
MASKVSRPERRQRPDHRPRVLAVDDDENNLLAIESVIEDIAEVVRAGSGEEALRHLLRDEFAVILLDIFLPGIDGYETAHFIRQRERSKTIPIIFLTAVNRGPDHMLQGYAMGAVDYVIKPFEPLMLRSKVSVFVELFEMTRQIRENSELAHKLLNDNLRIQTERLHAEQALRKAEERQALILRSLPIALFVEPLHIEGGARSFVSGDLYALTGFDEERLHGNPAFWAERIHDDDRERVVASRAASAERGTLAVEYRWHCADGQYRHFLEQAVLLHGDGDSAPEIAGTLLDVTERRSLESQLVQAQKMDAIGKLTGGVAHDFNNLLAAVLGGLSLIERKAPLDAEVSNIVAMTRQAAERGSDLVKRLLAFSRRQDLSPSIISLPDLQQTVSELLAHILGGLVQVEWSKSEPVWCAVADRNQLELAIINLVVNARDAMPNGGVIHIDVANRTVDRAARDGLAEGEYVVISVRDTGCGIAAAELERVIEPFYTTKPVGKGTGLGLSMVYGFARQSGGALHIDSVPGEGTQVDIWLPRAASVAHEGDPAEQSPAASVRHMSDRPRAILVVDDHDQVRFTTAAMLRELGHKVTEAAGGAEALKVIEKDPDGVDLVLTDYAMPAITGLELIRIARNSRPRLPAIIMTGFADVDTIGDRPRDVEILSKPLEPAALSVAIATALEPGRLP